MNTRYRINRLYTLLVVATALLLQHCTSGRSETSASPEEQKIEALVEEMSLEEKVGQMAQVTLDVVGKGENRYSSFEPIVLDKEVLRKVLVDYHNGAPVYV
jgi:beta-glucosidase